MQFPQRISSIHEKVRQLHGQFQPAAARITITSNGGEKAGEDDAFQQCTSKNRREMGTVGRSCVAKFVKRIRTNGGGGAFKCCAHRQVFYAQCLKLLALFAVAVAHLLFLHPFLELFSQLEKYVAQLDLHSAGTELLHHCVHDLADYKKNVWMTVAVLCIGLSTSSFFLFLLPNSTPVRKSYVFLIGLIDFVSFGCLPALFLARVSTVQRVHAMLGQALEQAHRLNSAEKLMNDIQCTIHPREKLPFCSELILRSLFPDELLKFLLVVCVMTLAYLALAYVIYWCIKHWVPHSSCRPSCAPLSACKMCPYCCCVPPSAPFAGGGCCGLYSPLGGFRRASSSSGSSSAASSRMSPLSSKRFFAYAPAAPLVVLPNPLAIPSEQCSPVPPPPPPPPAETTAEPLPRAETEELVPTEPVPPSSSPLTQI